VIGTAGNGDVDLGFRNAAGIVGVLSLDVPVGRGSPTALAGTYPDASPFYGPDGLGGVADALPPAVVAIEGRDNITWPAKGPYFNEALRRGEEPW
jgi:inosine-uridine nucleoside N-ribohydrolase